MHVQLYTYSTCSHCARARELLDARGIEYREESLDGNRDLLARLRQLFGKSTMPFVLIDGEPVGGLVELEELDRRGELA